MQRLAHNRMQSVARDDDIAALAGSRLTAFRSTEMRDGAALVLIHADALPSSDDRVLPVALDERIDQYVLQLAPMDGVLRVVIAREPAGWLPVDQLAEAIEEDGLARQDGHARKRRLETEGSRLGSRVRKDVAAHADRPDFRRELVNRAWDTGPMQKQRQRQPADAGADDDDLHAIAFMVTSILPKHSPGRCSGATRCS